VPLLRVEEIEARAAASDDADESPVSRSAADMSGS
jgi:hypothetical protein